MSDDWIRGGYSLADRLEDEVYVTSRGREEIMIVVDAALDEAEVMEILAPHLPDDRTVTLTRRGEFNVMNDEWTVAYE